MLRLRRTRWKIAYILIGVVSVFALDPVIRSLMFPNVVYAVASNSLTVLLYFGGVRSFRGLGEPIEPPRAWWRMTSRPRAGYTIGSLLVAGSAYGVYLATTEPPESTVTVALGVVVDATLAFLYFRSSIRLRRVPPRTVPEVPRWKPLKR
jgi:hypothetical protein